MKMALLLSMFLTLPAVATPVYATKVGKLAGVVSMLRDLKVKVESDGAAEDRAYHEFFSWCDKVTGEKLHAIQLDQQRLNTLKAEINKYISEVELYGQNVGQEAAAIAATIQDAKKAKGLRETQHDEFQSAQTELMESVEVLRRAITVLEESKRSGSSFAQILNTKMPQLLQVMKAITDAAAFTSSDRSKLVQLVQARDSAADDEVSAPSAQVYASKGGKIIDILEDMKDNAENQLSQLRQDEQHARYVFKKLRMALKQQQQADEKDLVEARKNKAASQENKAEAQAEKTQTHKVLDVETEEYESTKAHCMQSASNHERSRKSRKAELEALVQALKILKDSGAVSFFQKSSRQHLSLHTSSDLAGLEAMALVSRMSKKHHSTALAHLAVRMSSVIHSQASSKDIFAKVKRMIRNLISKLQKEAEDAATEKAYCEDQLSQATAQKGELEDQIKSLDAEMGEATAETIRNKDDVQELQQQLATIEEEQTELDKIRVDEHAAFLKAEKHLQLGVEGIRQAVVLLRDFYSEKDQGSADAPSEGLLSFLQVLRQPKTPEINTHRNSNAAGGIIQILETAELDFASSLAKIQADEANSQEEYKKATKEHELDRAVKQQEVKFKTRVFKRLDKKITQISTDNDAATTQQAAVTDFLAKIKDRCVAEPSSYEVRKEKREAEVMGLKEAQEILKNEEAFMQSKHFGVNLRGKILAT